MGFFDLFKKKRDDIRSSQKLLKKNTAVQTTEVKPQNLKDSNNQPEKAEITPKEVPLQLSRIDAINDLRKKIIEEIAQRPTIQYTLGSLFWEEAAKCFPNSTPWKWDSAQFKLDLNTAELYAEVCTYPNQFGANKAARYKLTAAELNKMALQFHLSEEVQCINTESDWAVLFDNEELKAAIQEVNTKLQEQEEEKWQKNRAAFAIVIPEISKNQKPTMEFTEIVITLTQGHGEYNYTHTVFPNKENYILQEQHTNLLGSITKETTRELTTQESVWIEKYINECIENQDLTTWQDVYGSSRMTVKIHRHYKPVVSLSKELPIKKYYELHHQLSCLTTYGSITKKEN